MVYCDTDVFSFSGLNWQQNNSEKGQLKQKRKVNVFFPCNSFAVPRHRFALKVLPSYAIVLLSLAKTFVV